MITYILMNQPVQKKDISLWIFILVLCTLIYILGFSLCIILLIEIVHSITN